MAEASDTQVVSATAKFVRVSPRKARLVADLVRAASGGGSSGRPSRDP